jgi:hypothetical protein
MHWNFYALVYFAKIVLNCYFMVSLSRWGRGTGVFLFQSLPNLIFFLYCFCFRSSWVPDAESSSSAGVDMARRPTPKRASRDGAGDAGRGRGRGRGLAMRGPGADDRRPGDVDG